MKKIYLTDEVNYIFTGSYMNIDPDLLSLVREFLAELSIIPAIYISSIRF